MDKLLPCQALKKKAKKAYRHRERQTSFYGIQKLGTPYMNSVAWGILAERTEKKKKHVPITNNDRWYLWLIIILLFLFENGGRLHDESKIWSSLRPCTLMYCMRDPCQLLCVCIASLKKKNPSFRKFDPVSYLLLEIRWVPLLEIKRNHYSIFSAKFIGPESDKAVQKFPE